MFSGSHTPYIFTQFPHLAKALDGFTHFPNAIGTSHSTISTVASLISGEYYTTYNMNERGKILQDSITQSFGDVANAFLDSNYNVSYIAYNGDFKATESLKNYTKNRAFIINGWQNPFYYFYVQREQLIDKINDAKANMKGVEVVQLVSFGLFRATPELFFRPRIYNDGLWLTKVDRKILDTMTSITYSSNLYAFTRNFKVDSTKPTFKYIHSFMTHAPYGMYFNGRTCEFFNENMAWEDSPKTVKMRFGNQANERDFKQHFDTESCALSYLADFIESLKKLGIYDNTQIFVVSDHGGGDGINVPNMRADTLFLFKDFNARGDLKVDSKLMANYDISSIFCENLPNGCQNVPPNILKNYPQNREIIHTAPISWQLERHKKDKWLIHKAYKVHKNYQDKANWQDISEKIANVPSARNEMPEE